MTDNSKDSTIKILLVAVTVLVGIVGAMTGHITTKAEIAEEIDTIQERFVPRKELDSRLSSIQRALNRIEARMERRESREDG